MYVLPGASYQYAKAVTPNDTLANTGDIKNAVALYIGGAGNLTIVQNVDPTYAGQAPSALTTVLIQSVPAGFMLSCAASWTNINLTGTAATKIVAFY